MATKHARFIRSAYILAAVAFAWTGGIVMLHLTYVQPNLERQTARIEQKTAGEWLRLANSFLRGIRGQIQRLNANWAGSAATKTYFLTRDEHAVLEAVTPEALARNRIAGVILCDPTGKVESAWRAGPGNTLARWNDLPAGRDLGPMAIFHLSAYADDVAGLGNTPLGLGLFARSAVRSPEDGSLLGYVVSVRPVDELLFGEVSAMVNATISLQTTPDLPRDTPLMNFGQVVWRGEGDLLKGAQVLRDSLGNPVGHLVAENRAEQAYSQTRTISHAMATTLLWAAGFAAVMILVIHVVVTGPTAHLLDRVQRLRSGEEVESLSAGLRGEALALAGQFQEVLGHVAKLSQTDALTGLSNRRSFQQAFVREFRRSRRYGRPMALAVLDLDFFKAANDALGHQTGDQMLKVFAQVITDNVRVSDLVARLGGDEFAVLMPETSGEEGVAVAERIRSGLAEKSVVRGDLKMTPTASVGVVDLNVPGGDTPEALFDLADQALYAAKRSGRNRTVRAEELEGVAALESAQDADRVDDLCKQLAGLDAKFKRLFLDAIGGLVSALEARDAHTANHSGKVRRYAMSIARRMNVSENAVQHIGRAAILHDVGKIGLPDSVLLKEGTLTEAEWQLVRRHPVMSVRIMEGMEFLDQEIPAVRYHHERFDGVGYPEGLSGSSIPLAARILSVADAFDAMTSSRVYRGGLSVDHAVSELRLGSGSQFDPAVVEAFLQVIREENIASEIDSGAPAAVGAGAPEYRLSDWAEER